MCITEAPEGVEKSSMDTPTKCGGCSRSTGKLSGVAPKHYAALELAGFGCKRTRDANLITGLRLRTREFSSSQEQLDDFLQ